MSLLIFSDIISRTRERLKAVRSDSWLTDRQIWSYYKPWINQEMKLLDAKSRLMAYNSLFQTLESVPLIEVDRLEAGCIGLKTGFTMMRTQKPIPVFMEGYWGPLIRSITSLDGTEELQPITPSGYQVLSNVSNFKFNKTKYYWYLNDHIYFPNLTWKAVRIEAITEEDISEYKCDPDEKCLPRQLQSFNVPDYILATAESKMMQSLGLYLQIPSDTQHDNSNPNR